MKDLKIKLYLILNIVQMVVSNTSNIYLDYFQYFLKYNIKLEFLIDYGSWYVSVFLNKVIGLLDNFSRVVFINL